MKLDEAIIHCEEKKEELNQRAESAENNGQYKFSDECKECASEHEQLAEWLKELKTLRKALMLACEYFEMEDAGLWYEHFLKKARENNDA